MKRIQRLSLFLVCLFAVPLFAAEAEQNFAGDGLQFASFPKLSISQERRPLQLATEDEYPCGPDDNLGPYCRWMCRPDGTPVLDENGNQIVKCRLSPEYEDTGGACNRYYVCQSYGGGYGCAYQGYWNTACVFLQGSNGCSSCTFY